jgi:DNA-binding transcriptional LysR family regulator
MELRHLRYFLMIAQTGNVRRAAERLHIAQPAVSRQLRDLEQELGVTLFDRLPRGLRLNAAGASFQADITRILGTIAAAGDRARRVAAGEIGHLKIGYLEVTGWQGPVPDKLHAFTMAKPDIRLELVSAHSPLQLKMIDDRELDGGFIYPVNGLPKVLVARKVRAGGVVIAYPARWSSRIRANRRLRDFADFPFIGFPREEHPTHHDRIIAACVAAGFSPRFAQREKNEGAILSMVSAGAGIAIVNDANMDRPPPLVRFQRVPDLIVPLDLFFVHRDDNDNPTLHAFVEILNRDLPARQNNRK